MTITVCVADGFLCFRAAQQNLHQTAELDFPMIGMQHNFLKAAPLNGLGYVLF